MGEGQFTSQVQVANVQEASTTRCIEQHTNSVLLQLLIPSQDSQSSQQKSTASHPTLVGLRNVKMTETCG
jgi:hypothetical protein